MKLTDRQQRRHKKDVQKHLGDEERRERKRAGNVRRALKKEKGAGRDPQVTEDNWEDLLDGHGGSKRRRPSLQEIAEQLRETPFASAEEERAAAENAGIVISVASKRCRVFLEGRELDCLVPAHLAVRQKSLLAVGDRVVVEENEDVVRVAAVLPRRSVLARPDPLNPHMQRLIAANIDVVVHVVSVKAPPLRPRLIDRFLIAILRGEAQPVICINKIDLLGDEERAEELAKLEPYRELGVPVIPCSTRSGEGLDAMRQEVLGKTSALVGHSGVGKSSILNALDQRLQIVTRTLHAKRGTGRHTTTASTLYDFGDETYLIDTPGIREFGLWDLTEDALRDYFPEFAEPSESCRFTDCTHVHEPDCQVKEQVDAGTLNRARYDTYVRLYQDLRANR